MLPLGPKKYFYFYASTYRLTLPRDIMKVNDIKLSGCIGNLSKSAVIII